MYYTFYIIKLKIFRQRFYCSSSKFSKFIQGKSPLLQQLASVSLLKEKSKICPKLTEFLSWNGPTVHVCCFMLARATTKTFVSRIHIRQPSPKTAKNIFVSRKIRQQVHSLFEVSLYLFSEVCVINKVCLYSLSHYNYLFIHLIIAVCDAVLRMFLNARHWRLCLEFASFESCRTTLSIHNNQFKNLVTCLGHNVHDKIIVF